MKITKTALRFRTSVYVLVGFLVLLGADAYRSLPLEAAPDVQIPFILVTTIYPGVAPAEMETLVTNVLERELKDLKDVKRMSSTSSESASVVSIEFESGVDMDDAYQKTRDQVDKAKPDLPQDAEDPILTEINISDFPIMLVNVYGDLDLVQLKLLAEGIEERIEAVPGVLAVDLTGGREREIQVLLDPERLQYFEIGVGQVINRIQLEHLNLPGGNLELGHSKYLLRVSGEFKDPSRIEDIVLKAPEGNPITIRDVGRVVDGFKDRETISRVNGAECVTLRVQKRAGENLVRIADEIRALLDEARLTLPPGVKILVQQDQSEHIRATVADLENSVISGLILVLAVLFFFMGLRNAIFVAIAIPLSLLITMGALSYMGITLNMVVLFALILALGMLVDNSIVVVESIFRYSSEGHSRMQAAYLGTTEVAWPIIASTATTVAVFLPLLFWPGIMGEFMSYLPKTVITSLLASLFVALVVNPVVAATFLRPGAKLFDDSGVPKGRLLLGYRHLLDWSLRFPALTLLLGVASLVGVIALFVVAGAGLEFFPQTTPERAQARVEAPLGTVLGQTNDLAQRVEAITGAEGTVETVVTNVGFDASGFLAAGGGGGATHKAVVDVEFKDRRERARSPWDALADMRAQMQQLSGGEFRIEVEEMGPPTGAAVDVQVSGPDYAVLYRLSQEVREALATVPGVVDIDDNYDPGAPEIKVEVDRDKAMRRKVDTYGVAMALRTAVNGTKAGVFREGDDESEIIVRYQPQFRGSIEDVLDLRVTGRDDVQVPLRDVARVRTQGGLGSINHVDRQRTISVTADVVERSSSEVLMEVRELLNAKVRPPDGYRLHFGGESEEQDRAAEFLGRAFLIGLLLIAMILVTQFNSVLRPFIILASIVMSMMGVMIGLLVTGNKFGIIMTGMGVISLAGVVVNNAIVLIDYIDMLRREGAALLEAVSRAGLVRFRPVLMTAITTVLGMLPMAVGVNIDFRALRIDVGSQSGEWWGPMAQAVVFGLLLATLLTLVMVPVMYLLQERLVNWIARWRKPDGAAAESEAAEPGVSGAEPGVSGAEPG